MKLTDKQSIALDKALVGLAPVQLGDIHPAIPAEVKDFKRRLLAQVKIADKILAIIAPPKAPEVTPY